MDIFAISLTVLGLVFFETITSLDNAVINAEILSKMSERARKWFLLWGILIAVFLIRGLLPAAIVWVANPHFTIEQVFTSTLSSDPEVVHAMEQSGPVLLIAGGMFLIFLFFHWLFLEPKHFGLPTERFFKKQGVWFFAIVSIILAYVTWHAINVDPLLAFGAVVGSTAFFIVHGFKQNAELQEARLREGKAELTDFSKLMYLEVIDATFSIDGVVGAFAFTFSIPLILIGNGIGAFMVRELTIRNIENVKKYVFLKNGAMYSIFFLGLIMVLDSFGAHIPSWVSPIITFSIVGFFFWKSVCRLNGEEKKNSNKKN